MRHVRFKLEREEAKRPGVRLKPKECSILIGGYAVLSRNLGLYQLHCSGCQLEAAETAHELPYASLTIYPSRGKCK